MQFESRRKRFALGACVQAEVDSRGNRRGEIDGIDSFVSFFEKMYASDRQVGVHAIRNHHHCFREW